MRTTTAALFTLATLFCCAQSPKAPQPKPGGQAKTKSKLMDLKMQLTMAAIMDKNSWKLADNVKYAPVRSDTMAYFLSEWVSRSKGGDSTWTGNAQEAALIEKHIQALAKVYDRMGLIGSELGYFGVTGTEVPVHFCMNGDTALTVYIHGIHIGSTFNTLKLTARQRATKVVTSFLIPELNDITSSFADTPMKFIALSAAYGSKDFSDDSYSSTQGELVAIVVPMKVAKDFAAGTITEDELVERMEVHVSDRDMIGELKRIKVTLE